MVSAAFVPNDGFLSKSESTVPRSGPRSFSNIEKVKSIIVHTPVSRVSATNENDGKSVHVCELKHEIYMPPFTVAEHDQITEVQYLMEEVSEEHKRKLRITSQRNEFVYTGDVLTVTLCSTL